jgi:hypothetical protein
MVSGPKKGREEAASLLSSCGSIVDYGEDVGVSCWHLDIDIVTITAVCNKSFGSFP